MRYEYQVYIDVSGWIPTRISGHHRHEEPRRDLDAAATWIVRSCGAPGFGQFSQTTRGGRGCSEFSKLRKPSRRGQSIRDEMARRQVANGAAGIVLVPGANDRGSNIRI